MNLSNNCVKFKIDDEGRRLRERGDLLQGCITYFLRKKSSERDEAARDNEPFTIIILLLAG